MINDPSPTNIVEKSLRELKTLEFNETSDGTELGDLKAQTHACVMALINTAAKLQHPGAVWSQTIQLLRPLLMGLPTTPLQNTDDEWATVKTPVNHPDEPDAYQNVRMDNVYKRDDGTCFCLNYYTFMTPKNQFFIAKASLGEIRGFPYDPTNPVIVPLDEDFNPIDPNHPTPMEAKEAAEAAKAAANNNQDFKVDTSIEVGKVGIVAEEIE